MKRISIRVEDFIFERLNLLAKESNVSLNKIITNIIIDSLGKPNEIINCLDGFNKSLESIEKSLNKISRIQNSHFKVSKQHFVNHGYLSNADINEDICLNELLNKDNNFND